MYVARYAGEIGGSLGIQPGVIALHSVSGEAEEEGEGDRQEERHPANSEH